MVTSHRSHRLLLTLVVEPLSKGSNYVCSRGYKVIHQAVPRLTHGLFQLEQQLLIPVMAWLTHLPVVSSLFEFLFHCFFFSSFLLLLVCEQIIRVCFSMFIGQHPSGQSISVVNAMDPTFDFATETQEQPSLKPSLLARMMNRPQYSLPLAYTLSVASKLGYEDVQVIRYELKQAGFDVDHTFQVFAFKNILAYVIEKDDMIFLVFRGSNPLNIQNYLTNLDVRMRKVYASWGYMGRVHQGYFDALGDPVLATETAACEAQSKKANRPRIFGWIHDPVDKRLVQGPNDINMYRQLEEYLLHILKKQQDKKLYITGHSLGAALGTMFLAKMVQSTSPLLSHLGGLYTFGQPKVNDEKFSKIFDAKLANVFARLPSYPEYASPAGTLIFVDSAFNMTIYPPDPYEGTPIAVPPISYLHLSGLLNRHVVERLPSESWLRLMFRLLAPYMINDHFAANYPQCLKKGKCQMTWVTMGKVE